jgi:uncharacterized protein
MTLFLLLALATYAQEWEPVDWPPPVPGVSAARPVAPEPEGAVERLYAWYHRRVSPRDGPRCPYYPTCSAYALESWRIHGPVGGLLLAVDRLLREYPWMGRDRFYPVVTPHEAPRFDDPVPR